MAAFDYDLFVIGAGSGGVRASRMAAAYGAKVGIAEADRAGGTCVIRGCIPKKLFAYAAHYSEDFEDARAYGWSAEAVRFDWPTLKANKDREIERLNGVYERLLRHSGVEIIHERAVFEDPHRLRLEGSGRRVSARHVLIATGSHPFLPKVPGIEHAVTSDDMFELDALPRRAVIVGAGYIAVEFASILNGLGVAVTILHRGAEILRGFDLDLRGLLHEDLENKGIRILLEAEVEAIEARDGERLVVLKDQSEIAADLVLYATGRRPNTAGLGLEAAGVACNERGAVKVDEYLRTNLPHVFAIGDVTDRLQLTPVAIREGAAVAATLFNDTPTAVDLTNTPTAVFSSPPIGTVGMTEEDAEVERRPVDIYKTAFRPLRHSLTGRPERTLMKLIVDPASDRVLGCHMLGPEAPELVQLAGVLLKMGARKSDFDATIAVHPTAAEELVTLREKAAPSQARAAE